MDNGLDECVLIAPSIGFMPTESFIENIEVGVWMPELCGTLQENSCICKVLPDSSLSEPSCSSGRMKTTTKLGQESCYQLVSDRVTSWSLMIVNSKKRSELLKVCRSFASNSQM